MSRRRVALVALVVLTIAALVAFAVQRGGGGDSSDEVPVGRSEAPAARAPEPLAAAGTKASSSESAISASGGKGEKPVDSTRAGVRLEVRGRVVDERHRPVEAAAVAARIAGAADATGVTDERGRFRVVVAGPPTDYPFVSVRATHDGGAASRGTAIDIRRTPAVDVGEFVLRHAADLVVRVVDAGRPVAAARVFASVAGIEDGERVARPGDEPVFIGWPHEATTDTSGVARLPDVPDGEASVLAIAGGPRRGEGRTTQPAGHVVDVAVVPARDVVVEVVERGGDGTTKPVAGVQIGLETASKSENGQWGENIFDEPIAPRPTDANGRTIVPALPRGRLFGLTVLGDGWLWPRWRSCAPVSEEADHVRIEVPTATSTVRLAATFGDGPAPENGTTVALDPTQDGRGWWGAAGLPVRAGRIEDGHLVIDGLRNPKIEGLARLPDGRIAWFTSFVEPPKSARFLRPRSVSVVVKEEDGTPATGVVLNMRLEGGWRVLQGVPLAPTGETTIGDLPQEKFVVVVESHPELVAVPYRLGVMEHTLVRPVDLCEKDARVEITVPPVVDAAVRLENSPGTPLPPGLVVLARASGVEFVDPRDATWDEAAAEVRFRTRRPVSGGIGVCAMAPGISTRLAVLRWVESRRRLEALVDLGPTGGVAARVATREGVSFQLALDRRRGDAWEPERRLYSTGEPIQGIDDVPVGRYRLRDLSSGLISEEGDVLQGRKTELRLDLSMKGEVNVVVFAPPGADVARIAIRCEGTGIASYEENPRAEGRGELRTTVMVPGDRPVRIVASHPDLVSDGAGEATVTKPGGTVELRLVPRGK